MEAVLLTEEWAVSVVVGGLEEAALVLGRGWPGERTGRAMLDTNSQKSVP
jgi:hypothetical protein